jgi:transcriptional regulator with XRE-family HTH domain
MRRDYFELIKELRLQKGLSQAEIAKRIGVSRQSYLSFEQGKTELNLSEIIKLTDLLGISLDEIKHGVKPNYPKYKQMILAYLRTNLGSKAKITKTKLAKLLYLADFAWFYDNLHSMSGMAYRKIQYGPVPDSYFRALDELFEEGSIDIDNTTKDGVFLISQTESGAREKLDSLNAVEQALIKKIAKKWQDKRTQEIVKFTHEQLPYALCDDNEIIPYSLITQENPDHVY